MGKCIHLRQELTALATGNLETLRGRKNAQKQHRDGKGQKNGKGKQNEPTGARRLFARRQSLLDFAFLRRVPVKEPGHRQQLHAKDDRVQVKHAMSRKGVGGKILAVVEWELIGHEPRHNDCQGLRSVANGGQQAVHDAFIAFGSAFDKGKRRYDVANTTKCFFEQRQANVKVLVSRDVIVDECGSQVHDDVDDDDRHGQGEEPTDIEQVAPGQPVPKGLQKIGKHTERDTLDHRLHMDPLFGNVEIGNIGEIVAEGETEQSQSHSPNGIVLKRREQGGKVAQVTFTSAHGCVAQLINQEPG